MLCAHAQNRLHLVCYLRKSMFPILRALPTTLTRDLLEGVREMFVCCVTYVCSRESEGGSLFGMPSASVGALARRDVEVEDVHVHV